MPLEKGPPGSLEFKHNIETEMAAGKPQSQAVAIAYRQSGEKHDTASRLDAILKDCERLHDRMDAMSRRDGGDEPGNGHEPYGDVRYADPGLQADKKKRYPVDTEEHIRAAWNYFSHPKDRDEYTPENRAKVKANILRAWKEKIGGEPPSAE